MQFLIRLTTFGFYDKSTQDFTVLPYDIQYIDHNNVVMYVLFFSFSRNLEIISTIHT